MKDSFIQKIISSEFVKFGEFTLKSGKKSNIYFDLRNIISEPLLVLELTELLNEKISLSETDRICGVPYGAIPIATALSLKSKIPMILKRKEIKTYGGKKMIEGKFNVGDKVLLIEDVITSGESLLETIKELEEVGLQIGKIVVVLDRQEGGSQLLRDKGYILESITTKEELLQKNFGN